MLLAATLWVLVVFLLAAALWVLVVFLPAATLWVLVVFLLAVTLSLRPEYLSETEFRPCGGHDVKLQELTNLLN